MGPAGDPGPQPGPADHAEAAPAGRVGAWSCHGNPLPAGVFGAVAPEAGTCALPAAAPCDRARHGLSPRTLGEPAMEGVQRGAVIVLIGEVQPARLWERMLTTGCELRVDS